MSAKSCLAAPPSKGLREGDLINVYEALHPVRKKYDFLGLHFGMSKTEIDSIEADQSDSGKCLLEILSVRLKKAPALTWGDIDKALRSKSIGEHLLANELQQTHYGQSAGPSRGRSSCESASDQQPQQKMYKRERKRKFEGDTSPVYRSKTSRVEDSDEKGSKGKRKAKRDHKSFPTNPKESHAIDAKQEFERKIRKRKKRRKSVRVAEHGEKTSGKETRCLKSAKGKGKRKVLPVMKARNVKILHVDETYSDTSQNEYEESHTSSSTNEEDQDLVETLSNEATEIVDSYSAREESSGEGGRSNRHRKGERDEHSDARGKRYRESNISPIATRSTVKTRLSATDLDEDSSSAGEECSGEERGTSNRHRKEERDEVRSKHSDARGKRYRESNISPIATRSTVKTRSPAPVESYSAGEESSGEERGRSNRHRKEERDEVRSKHSDDRGKRYRESNVSPIATRSTVKTRSSATDLDEDSSSAGEECSGEERGTSNRHRKEERDEVRSKHSDARGKRYRESNISPIATRSTVKTRLSATNLDEDSSSAGEECSGEERGTSNRHRKEERDEVRSKHSDDRGKRYRESNVSPIATRSTVKTRLSATDLDEDSSSAGEECSGEERGTSNRYRKEERDEVRSKHSDDRGKRYRESNVSPIATRSTVKTRLSATDLDEDSSSTGEECSGEERGTSNRYRKEERDEVRSKHSDDRGERYRESTVSPIATSSTVKTRSSKHSDNRGNVIGRVM